MARIERRFDEAMEYFDAAITDAEQEIIDRGFMPPIRPGGGDEFDGRPVMPPNLDDCQMHELQYLLGKFTEWYTYASNQLAESENQMDKCIEKEKYAWSKIRSGIREGTVSDKDDAVRTDQRHSDIVAERLHWKSRGRWMKVICESLMREIETISRAVTMMEQRMGVEGKAARAGRRIEVGQRRKRRDDALSRFQRNRSSR